jgi:hypothetical protein
MHLLLHRARSALRPPHTRTEMPVRTRTPGEARAGQHRADNPLALLIGPWRKPRPPPSTAAWGEPTEHARDWWGCHVTRSGLAIACLQT